jgi:hypothetical protein
LLLSLARDDQLCQKFSSSITSLLEAAVPQQVNVPSQTTKRDAAAWSTELSGDEIKAFTRG